jgi:hypothetical protein
LIPVTAVKPFYRIVTPESSLDERCNFAPLETDADFLVACVVFESFESLVERFLVNGKAAVNSVPAQHCREVKVVTRRIPFSLPSG